jgi:hypothetical protein
VTVAAGATAGATAAVTAGATAAVTAGATAGATAAVTAGATAAVTAGATVAVAATAAAVRSALHCAERRFPSTFRAAFRIPSGDAFFDAQVVFSVVSSADETRSGSFAVVFS